MIPDKRSRRATLPRVVGRSQQWWTRSFLNSPWLLRSAVGPKWWKAAQARASDQNMALCCSMETWARDCLSQEVPACALEPLDEVSSGLPDTVTVARENLISPFYVCNESPRATHQNDKAKILGNEHWCQSQTVGVLRNELTKPYSERFCCGYHGSLRKGRSQLIDQRKETSGGRTIIEAQ